MAFIGSINNSRFILPPREEVKRMGILCQVARDDLTCENKAKVFIDANNALCAESKVAEKILFIAGLVGQLIEYLSLHILPMIVRNVNKTK